MGQAYRTGPDAAIKHRESKRSRVHWTDRSRGPIIPAMDVRAQWYDVVAARISRRRFDGRPVPAELREQLELFCDGASAPPGSPIRPLRGRTP